jgi:hypothetical protein
MTDEPTPGTDAQRAEFARITGVDTKRLLPPNDEADEDTDADAIADDG